jgi:hypothetical protein
VSRPRQWIFYSPQSPYVPDEVLGYADRPGFYSVKLTARTGRYHTFSSTIDQKGNRVTSFAPELFEGKKEIWIFGDSSVYGWGNNDETTFPFLLQQRLPQFRIVNYADIGYGNIHAYLQLKKELRNTHVIPQMIVIVYGWYFNMRNVATPSRLRDFKEGDHLQNPSIDPSAFRHPRASVKDGKLEIEYVPLYWRFHNASEEKEPSKQYQYEVTKRILAEIYDLGTKSGATVIFAYIDGEDSDEVVAFAKKHGYVFADIRPRPGRNEYDDFAPYDTHPGPLAQDNFAVKLHGVISKVVSDSR